MSADLLKNLCGVPAVRGAVLYTEGGACVEHHLPPPFERNFVQAVVEDLQVAFESYSYLEPAKVTMALVKATNGLMAFMATNRFHVLALADPGVNLAFIKVAFGALQHKLAGMDADLVLEAAEAPPAVAAPAAPPPPAPAPVPAAVAAPTRDVPHGGYAPPALMDRLVKTFTEFVGPAARLVVKDELGQLGFTMTTCPLDRVHEVVARLATRLPAPAQRDALFAIVGKK